LQTQNVIRCLLSVGLQPNKLFPPKIPVIQYISKLLAGTLHYIINLFSSDTATDPGEVPEQPTPGETGGEIIQHCSKFCPQRQTLKV
jgi:hypothetical protein